MPNSKIEEFLNDLKKLDLQFPVATIVRETGYSKGLVSVYVNGKREPSEKFLKGFKKAFFGERTIIEDDVKLKEGTAPYYALTELGISGKKSIDTILQVIKVQADTIASQQETIKLLTMKLHPMAAGVASA